MTLHDIFPVEDDNVDRIVRVKFRKSNDGKNVLNALSVLNSVLQRGAAANRFESLIALEMTSEFCEIRLRYFSEPKRKELGLSERGYSDPVGTWFLQYLIAKVDSVFPIEEHPFYVDDLSVVLAEPEPFDSDP